jgi:hypothetical protein
LTDAVVLRSDSEPLLGMALLWGSRVTLDAIEQGEVSIRELQAGSSNNRPDRPTKLKQLAGILRGWSKVVLLVLVFGIVGAAVIVAFTYGVISLPLDFGGIVTFMGIWLAIGVVLGQNKPPETPVLQYLSRRIVAYVSCYVFFVAIAIAYAALVGEDASNGIKREEVFGLLVVSLVSFAPGFFAGQDKERKP